MKPHEYQELKPIMEAFASRRSIQTRNNEQDTTWHDVHPDASVSFRKPPSCYRIKPPEPPPIRAGWRWLMEKEDVLQQGDAVASRDYQPVTSISIGRPVCIEWAFARRITPERVWRPWKPEEVPLGCWFREIGDTKNVFCLVAILRGFVHMGASRGIGVEAHSMQSLFSHCEHSTDNGKTWQPCGVQE